MRRHLFRFFLPLLLLLLPCQPEGFAAQTGSLEIAGQRFQVEVAATPAAREKGLMNRSRLAAGKGMLFVFPGSGMYPFWMKNTLIPLDLIWIDEHWQVIGVSRMQPCGRERSRTNDCPLFYPPAPVRYALEVNAGEAQGCRGKVFFDVGKGPF